jgi:putative transcriptional regulator
MMKLEFEWHEDKAHANLEAHGVGFELAKAVFKDPFAVERHDDRENYGEERFVITGMAEGAVLLFVMSKTTTSNKILKPMTDEAVEKAARADRDALPLTEADTMRMKRTPQAKIIRRALELTQEDFAARYQIPLGTLRDWEQGRSEPDQPARAYLKLIARAPEHVDRLLNTKTH